MRPLPLALGASTLIAFAAAIGLATYGEAIGYLPHLFIESDWVVKASVAVCLAVLVWATRLRNASGEANRRLNITAMLSVGLGLMFSLLLFNNPGLVCVDETKVDMLKVMGSKYAQDLIPISFGLLTATVAAARVRPMTGTLPAPEPTGA